MENIRARVDSIVKDKKTAELLKPWLVPFPILDQQLD
jgi:hypothetical protein